MDISLGVDSTTSKRHLAKVVVYCEAHLRARAAAGVDVFAE